ncbi:TPA: hypothetical protein EYP70_06850 [Candidatus Bathyarchaeota archaeon]|nr:hypothetical protein [Candidatus Bathyarchaeota archaeon]
MYLLGLDVGTTGCKSVIFSVDGSIVSSAYEEYVLYHKRPEWSELNPEEVWQAVVSAIKRSIRNAEINSRAIEAISVSVLGEAFIPIDDYGKFLRWSMTTFDARAEKQVKWWETHFNPQKMYEITGQPLTSSMPIYTLQKIQWIRENEPQIYKKTWKFLCWEDYVNFRLCGKPVTDRSIATRTMMYDIKSKRWSKEILEIANIDEDLLPEVELSGTPIGEVTETASQETGLSEGTLVVTGGHDQACGALGAGVIDEGPAMDATGTVECIAVAQRRPVLTQSLRAGGFAVHCYVTDDLYYTFGFNPCGGVILRWFRDNFAEKERELAQNAGTSVYDILIEMASESPLGSLSLFLLPYFEGSGTPIFNRKARGAIIGLTLAHKKKDIIRGILEGLTYELRNNIEAIEKNGIAISELRAIGGGAKSSFWLQLKADVTGKMVVAPNVTEAAALGAAILAGVGSGAFRNVEDGVKNVYKVRALYRPNKEIACQYEKYYQLYKKIYWALREIFEELNEINV